MSGPDFFQTRMGQRFFEATVPNIVHQITRIADLLENSQSETLKKSSSEACGTCEECVEGIRCRELESLTQYDDGTYLLLSEEGAVLAVSGNSEFDDIDKAPTEEGIIVRVLGNYFPSEKE